VDPNIDDRTVEPTDVKWRRQRRVVLAAALAGVAIIIAIAIYVVQISSPSEGPHGVTVAQPPTPTTTTTTGSAAPTTTTAPPTTSTGTTTMSSSKSPGLGS
jgi:hypothetical protein